MARNQGLKLFFAIISFLDTGRLADSWLGDEFWTLFSDHMCPPDGAFLLANLRSRT